MFGDTAQIYNSHSIKDNIQVYLDRTFELFLIVTYGCNELKQKSKCVTYAVLNVIYYMEESVLLGTKPPVDSIRHFIRDPSGVFSVCHLCECRIVQ